MAESAAPFRKQADKCQQMADKALGLDKEGWLDLTTYWRKKAEEAERTERVK